MGNLFTQEIQDMLQGPTLLEVLSDPVGLRSTIVALESAIELLRDNEQRLYPEQAPKAGRSRRNEGISDTSDPVWQRDKILRVFQKTHQTFTPTQLHGQYIKSVDAALLEARCDELVGLGNLAVLDSRRASDGRKYCLPSDVPSEPKPEPYKPRKYFQVKGQEVGAYCFALMSSHNKTPAYLINGDEDLAVFYKDSDRLMDVPRNVIVYKCDEEFRAVESAMKACRYELLPPNRIEPLPDPPIED